MRERAISISDLNQLRLGCGLYLEPALKLDRVAARSRSRRDLRISRLISRRLSRLSLLAFACTFAKCRRYSSTLMITAPAALRACPPPVHLPLRLWHSHSWLCGRRPTPCPGENSERRCLTFTGSTKVGRSSSPGTPNSIDKSCTLML